MSLFDVTYCVFLLNSQNYSAFYYEEVTAFYGDGLIVGGFNGFYGKGLIVGGFNGFYGKRVIVGGFNGF